eukprot:1179286-Prorocentrum_minimum.AAC.4
MMPLIAGGAHLAEALRVALDGLCTLQHRQHAPYHAVATRHIPTEESGQPVGRVPSKERNRTERQTLKPNVKP